MTGSSVSDAVREETSYAFGATESPRRATYPHDDVSDGTGEKRS
jgi:hypothetical protein